MKISEQIAQIAEREKSALLEAYCHLIADPSPEKLPLLAAAIKELAALGIDVDVDADHQAHLDVKWLENKLEPQPEPGAQKQHEAKIAAINEETREAAIVPLFKSFAELDWPQAAEAAKHLAGRTLIVYGNNGSEQMEEHAAQKRIDTTESAEEIADIAVELVRGTPLWKWESTVRDLVQKHQQLDRRPIFAAIDAGNGKLKELPEAPKEVESRNHWRRHEIGVLKQKRPLAFAQAVEVKPPATDEPETSSEPVDQPPAEPVTDATVENSELVSA